MLSTAWHFLNPATRIATVELAATAGKLERRRSKAGCHTVLRSHSRLFGIRMVNHSHATAALCWKAPPVLSAAAGAGSAVATVTATNQPRGCAWWQGGREGAEHISAGTKQGGQARGSATLRRCCMPACNTLQYAVRTSLTGLADPHITINVPLPRACCLKMCPFSTRHGLLCLPPSSAASDGSGKRHHSVLVASSRLFKKLQQQ